MALSGLEDKLRDTRKSQRARQKKKINMIAYADDFIVTASSEQLLREEGDSALEEALKKVGLELSSEKTKITQVHMGFDFLGFNIRKYPNGKLLIKPSEASISTFVKETKDCIKKGVALPTEKLIHLLNQKITGWTNYYRSVVSSKVFSTIDHEIFMALKKCLLRRHPRKGQWWIMRKYFTTVGEDHWRFHCTVKDKSGDKKLLYLKQASETLIRRHKKIKAEAGCN